MKSHLLNFVLLARKCAIKELLKLNQIPKLNSLYLKRKMLMKTRLFVHFCHRHKSELN